MGLSFTLWTSKAFDFTAGSSEQNQSTFDRQGWSNEMLAQSILVSVAPHVLFLITILKGWHIPWSWHPACSNQCHPKKLHLCLFLHNKAGPCPQQTDICSRLFPYSLHPYNEKIKKQQRKKSFNLKKLGFFMSHFHTYRNLLTPQQSKGIYKPSCLWPLSLFGNNLFSRLSFHQIKICIACSALQCMCLSLTMKVWPLSAQYLLGSWFAGQVPNYLLQLSRPAALPWFLVTKPLPLICLPGKSQPLYSHLKVLSDPMALLTGQRASGKQAN